MPIDPSIALNVRQVQQTDPMESMGRILALRNAMQMAPIQQEEARQRLQATQQENQQRQMDLDSQQKLTQVYTQTGGDPDKLFPAAIKAGVAPKHLQALQSSLMEQATKKATLDKATLENNATKNDALNALMQPVLAESDPQKQAALWNQQQQEAVAKGIMTPQEAQQHPYPGSPDAVKQYEAGLATDKWTTAQAAKIKADAAQQQADLAQKKFAIERPSIEAGNVTKGLAAAGQSIAGVDSQAEYDAWRNDNPEAAKRLPPMFSPATKDLAQRLGMTAEQRTQADQAKANAAETARHNLSSESTAKLNASIAAGRLAQEKLINGMKYGPGTQQYWVQQLQDNPDSIKEMPAELRSSVGQGFTKATGLPLPTPASAENQKQETAARNAQDGITFIQKALQNPEIARNIGPIMGRLGNAEQAVGTAVGLSPEAEKMAQELRTRMRYFVFQEGKAVLGGRLPQNLMKALEESSANVKMDPNMLQGALNGAAGNAQSVMDNVDRQRFGGKMRPSAQRQSAPAQQQAPQGAPKAGTVEQGYRFKGGDPAKQENWEKVQ